MFKMWDDVWIISKLNIVVAGKSLWYKQDNSPDRAFTQS